MTTLRLVNTVVIMQSHLECLITILLSLLMHSINTFSASSSERSAYIVMPKIPSSVRAWKSIRRVFTCLFPGLGVLQSRKQINTSMGIYTSLRMVSCIHQGVRRAPLSQELPDSGGNTATRVLKNMCSSTTVMKLCCHERMMPVMITIYLGIVLVISQGMVLPARWIRIGEKSSVSREQGIIGAWEDEIRLVC